MSTSAFTKATYASSRPARVSTVDCLVARAANTTPTQQKYRICPKVMAALIEAGASGSLMMAKTACQGEVSHGLAPNLRAAIVLQRRLHVPGSSRWLVRVLQLA